MPGFEPTYEELKPAIPCAGKDILLCFEPTYEELKLPCSSYRC